VHFSVLRACSEAGYGFGHKRFFLARRCFFPPHHPAEIKPLFFESRSRLHCARQWVGGNGHKRFAAYRSMRIRLSAVPRLGPPWSAVGRPVCIAIYTKHVAAARRGRWVGGNGRG
jgi:hypothetical protein